ncbi:MAG: cyclic nucleotide-binding domain-containing protein [Nitrospina sp.]|nr:cyclic nucleotide-binding domain-containing protein [Nitrospina sp.]
MEKDPILEFIERLPFFKEFSDQEKVKLLGTPGIFEKYENGKNIIKEGEIGAALFVVLTGSIRITKSIVAPVKEGHISLQKPREIGIVELKAGSIFGEVSMLSYRPRNTNAYANSQQVVVMKFTQEIIEKFNLSIQKKFQDQLILTLVHRLDDINKQYIQLKSSIEQGNTTRM